MNFLKSFSGLRNLLWSLGIVICLLALFIGLVISAFCRYSGNTAAEDAAVSVYTVTQSSADGIDGSDYSADAAAQSADTPVVAAAADSGTGSTDAASAAVPSAAA